MENEHHLHDRTNRWGLMQLTTTHWMSLNLSFNIKKKCQM